GRNEPFVDHGVDGIRVVDGDERRLIGVRRLPELLGELQAIASVFGDERAAWNLQILLGREGRREARAPVPADVLVGAWVVEGLWHAVWPRHADHVGLEMMPEPDQGDAVGDGAALIEIANANLERRADAERVVLSAAGAEAG